MPYLFFKQTIMKKLTKILENVTVLHSLDELSVFSQNMII